MNRNDLKPNPTETESGWRYKKIILKGSSASPLSQNNHHDKLAGGKNVLQLGINSELIQNLTKFYKFRKISQKKFFTQLGFDQRKTLSHLPADFKSDKDNSNTKSP